MSVFVIESETSLMKTLLEIPIKPDANTATITREKLHARLSPFDFPTWARLMYDRNVGHFRIEFDYLTPEEPKITHNIYDDVYIETGRFSRKLYSVGLQNVKRPIDWPDDVLFVVDELKKAVELELGKYDLEKPKDRLPFLSFSFAKEFLSREERHLRSAQIAL